MNAVAARPRVDWQAILPIAASIVRASETLMTLRQLFYRLVSKPLLVNTVSSYKMLSRRTAEARREGTFPDLIDLTRGITEDQTFAGPDKAREWLANIYRRDRTEGQAYSIYLGVEKEGIVAQLRAWFGDLGVPILALKGYSSVSFESEVQSHIERSRRPAALLYAGDFDPSGEDILDNFTDKVGLFDIIERVALTEEQIELYDLPEAMGKATDTRAAGFIARYGRLVQVEVDALPPDTLRDLYQEAIDVLWDSSIYESVLEQEAAEREQLRKSEG